MRKLLSLFSIGALVVGLSLTAVADSSAPDTGTKKEPAKTKGKQGDACKTGADCDQTANPQTCANFKCAINYPPPPT